MAPVLFRRLRDETAWGILTGIRNRIHGMKRTMTMLLAVIIGTGALAPVVVTSATSVQIAIGDQPYYTHGAFYIENGVRWEWVPGHWARRDHKRVWVHGHYVRR